MRILAEFGDLRPAASHILEVEVAPGRDKLIRQAAILAADTEISMETVEFADEDLPRSGRGPSHKKSEVAASNPFEEPFGRTLLILEMGGR